MALPVTKITLLAVQNNELIRDRGYVCGRPLWRMTCSFGSTAALLDEPVPMLGNRAAARSARGRRELVVWLKHLENRSSRAPDPADPMAT